MSTSVNAMADAFEQRFQSNWPVESWRNVTVLLAVSGGPDSVALLRAMHAFRPRQCAGRLIVAHANHQLRGAESDADAQFVQALCDELGVACEIGVLELSRLDTSDGLEAAARDARYAFLAALANQYGARYLATGHTADDQAETILYRILRGTGLGGLAGIPRTRPLSEMTTLLRPLLGMRRNDVLTYLLRLGQPYRVDATNAAADFTRNRLRNELLPQLAREYNPAVVDALLRLGQLAGEAQAILRAQACELHVAAAKPLPDGGWQIDGSMLAKAPPYLVCEMLIELWQTSQWPLQSMGLGQWQLLLEMMNPIDSGSSAKQVFPGNVLAEWSHSERTLRLSRRS